MRVAIIHDSLVELGGAERVLWTFLKIFPSADLYIPLISQQKLNALREVYTGRIYSLPFKFPFPRIASYFKPFLYFYWELLNLNDYDLVISSSHSFSSKSVITSPHTLHISYIYTPPRYLYSEFNEMTGLRRPVVKTLTILLFSWLRVWDYIGAQRPDVIIAISQTVARRIKKYYRRDCQVIYPPCTLPKPFNTRNKKDEYFLVVSRLAKQKGIELAIEACNQLKLRLLVVGEGANAKYLRKIAGTTVAFTGRVSDKQLDAIYLNAKALIYCSVEEDFGIVPVEAMAHGVPVIAYNSGATAETVLPGETGIFFNEYSVESLNSAIKQFNHMQFSASVCIRQANKFSETKFITQLQTLIRKHIPQYT